MNIKNGFMIATAVAGLLGGAQGCSEEEKVQGTQQPVKCQGINDCKGMGDCAFGDAGSCKGMNDCKGMGFVEVDTAKVCTDKGGTVLS